MNARRRRPSSRQRRRTRRQRCFGTRAFRLTSGSGLVSRAVACPVLRSATADTPLPWVARPPLRGYPPILRSPGARVVRPPDVPLRFLVARAEVAELADA